jgi:hypothetical protein
MKVTLDLQNLSKIDSNIESIQRVIDGKPLRPCDTAPLIDMKYILLQIKDRVENDQSLLSVPKGYFPIIHKKCGKVAYFMLKKIDISNPRTFLTPEGKLPDPDAHVACGSCGEEMSLQDFFEHIMKRSS